MDINQIKRNNFYVARLYVELREDDKQKREFLVRVININFTRNEVEVVFPPFNVPCWISADSIIEV